MVKIAPFKGITYNFNKLKADKTLFAPPYDVISPQYQEELYERNPYNIVRLILGRTNDSDDNINNRYTRAAEEYSRWLKEGVLVESDKPKIYFYAQEYIDSKGDNVTRKGFIASCHIEDFENKEILPHEETMGGPKKDRLNLMMATNANLCQIFVVYSDPEKLVDSIIEKACPEKPSVDIFDDDGVRHVFFEISDKTTIDKVVNLMANKKVLIADGHHRYETAIQYRNMRRLADNSNDSENKIYDSMMIYFANLDDEGLRVYPTHRALKVSDGKSLNELLDKLKAYFSIREVSINQAKECFNIMEKQSSEDIPIGLLCRQSPEKLYILKPDLTKIPKELSKEGVPELLAKFDATILHRFILEKLMGLKTVDLKNQNNIEFIRNEKLLIDKFDREEAELVFLLSSPDLAIVKDVCMSGYRMPQKSTYFYPKLLSGLVIRSLK